MRQTTAMLTILVALSAAFCMAEPQHYFEAGDFSNSKDTPTLLTPTLGLGTNTVSGSAAGTLGQEDNDYFEVQLPTGLLLAEIYITIENYDGASNPDIGSLGLDPTRQGAIDIVTNGTFQLDFTLENPKKIVFFAQSPVYLATLTYGSFDYTISLIVENNLPVLNLDSAGTLTWNAITGRVYQVQWAEQLITNAWYDLGGAITATTDTVTVHDDITSISHRFYRVMPPAAP